MYTNQHMNMTFAKAPLAEIVAELRWGQQPTVLTEAQMKAAVPIQVSMNSSVHDEFFMHLGREVNLRGFQRSERIVPSGFPLMLFQPVYRFRKSAESDDSVLLQAGPGMFSANAVPPYRSWDEFSPVVEAGVQSLLKSRHKTESELPFSILNLRYIDAFTQELTGGRDIDSFLKEILGISVVLPKGISNLLVEGEKVKPHLQLSLPVSNNMKMNISIGEGFVNNEACLLMDTTVSTLGDVPADIKSVMETFHAARILIHDMFFDLTLPIQNLMQPNVKG